MRVSRRSGPRGHQHRRRDLGVGQQRPRHRGWRPACVTYRWIDSQADFEALIDRLCAEPRYALDTEFHRERTYFPKLALMQLAWEGGIALVDPLACEPKGLVPLLTS